MLSSYWAIAKCQEPLRYYRNNVHSALTLCQVMEEFGVKRLIFSSSATVYGSAGVPPFDENAPLAPANPYGQAKHIDNKSMDQGRLHRSRLFLKIGALNHWIGNAEGGVRSRRVRCNQGSDRCIAERSQDRVDASLIARALRLEPLQDVLVDSKRD